MAVLTRPSQPYQATGGSHSARDSCFDRHRNAHYSKATARSGYDGLLSSVCKDNAAYLRDLWIDVDFYRDAGPAGVVDTGGHADVQAQSQHRLRHFRSSVDGMPLHPERTLPAAGL